MLTHFLNIIKWKNLLHITVVQFMLKYCFLYGYNFETKLSFVDLILLSITTTSILASGYLYSYYIDNKKRYMEIFSKDHAVNIAMIFGIVGVFLGTYLSFFVGKPYYSFIFIIALFALISYYKTVRTKTFFSNIVNSFIRIFSALLVWWFDYPVSLDSLQLDLFFQVEVIAMSFIAYSFFANIIRGILYNIKYIDKDHQKKQQTLPVLLGRKRAKNIANAILIGLLILTVVILVLFIKDKFIKAIIFITVIVPQLWLIYHLSSVDTPKQYESLFKKSNIAYYFTFLSVPLFTYYFKYVIQ
ncbi:conserved membrane protein of unknown function [Tenacibaculum sp. 190130A14a]|uniref:Prenyltransferase n=2 Tax=Tenacibaculum polynesiense TaxID=3137857 RepID=A0ABM9PC90_9FLAO